MAVVQMGSAGTKTNVGADPMGEIAQKKDEKGSLVILNQLRTMCPVCIMFLRFRVWNSFGNRQI